MIVPLFTTLRSTTHSRCYVVYVTLLFTFCLQFCDRSGWIHVVPGPWTFSYVPLAGCRVCSFYARALLTYHSRLRYILRLPIPVWVTVPVTLRILLRPVLHTSCRAVASHCVRSACLYCLVCTTVYCGLHTFAGLPLLLLPTLIHYTTLPHTHAYHALHTGGLHVSPHTATGACRLPPDWMPARTSAPSPAHTPPAAHHLTHGSRGSFGSFWITLPHASPCVYHHACLLAFTLHTHLPDTFPHLPFLVQ